MPNPLPQEDRTSSAEPERGSPNGDAKGLTASYWYDSLGNLDYVTGPGGRGGLLALESGNLSGSKRSTRSRRAPMVLMHESAQNVTATDDRPGRLLGGQSGIGRLKVQAPMRPGPVVMIGVRTEDALQVASTKDEDVVEALSSNGADPTLRERVREGHRNHRSAPRPVRS